MGFLAICAIAFTRTNCRELLMTRMFLIASVAALAITAPVQAEKGDKGGKPDRAERAQDAPSAQRVRAERPQRQERVRMERPQMQQRVRMERPQRPERVRMERPQRQERVRMERPLRQERVRMERPQREQRVRFDRPQREQRVRVEQPKRERMFRAERPQREQRIRMERREREQRVAKIQNRVERRSVIERQQSRRAERFASQQQRQAERLAKFQNRAERKMEQQALKQDFRQAFRDARVDHRIERNGAQKIASVIGQRFDTAQVNRDWYDDYAAQRVVSFTNATPNYFYDYDYDDGYLYQVSRDNGLVTALYPLLGGAFSTGRVLPIGYQDYNVPYAYRSLYYDTPDYMYRFGDGGIYRVDPTSQMIQAVVALLTGQDLGVGQMLPMGYDVYNVPYAYRDTFYDTNDAWYRYDDGFIYQVDPYSRMIQGMYPVSYGNYAVGYPAPAYASYGGYGAYAGYPSYAVPYDYQRLYYGAPGYNYHYANNGIYQVDSTTRLISALVALVTGTNLGVGQMLPSGYDVYNVPTAYRASYFDTDDAWYRYDDGYIYQVDPYSRVIQSAIPVSYDGYVVGQPIPAAYPGYAVPDLYSGLYQPVDGYDYRYFDGGIYQVQPQTRVVVAPVALVTGNNWAVGQPMPVGYDVYNVPYAYRDEYYDNDEYMYRYADGHIYQVDPQTRLIRAVIDAIV
jgi:hypothetical protein